MELRASSFAAALLLLLLASRATDASPLHGRTTAASPERTGFAPAAAEVELTQQEEGAVELNEEEGEGSGPQSWYKLLPRVPQGEQGNSEAALSVPSLKQKWEAVAAQVLKQIRASAAKEKFPALLEKLDDAEVRKNLLNAALGAAGMTATGLMLGDYDLLRQMSLMALYLTALFQLLKSGANLASTLASDASEEEKAARTDQLLRQKLAKLFGVHPEDHLTTVEEADDQ